MSISEKDDGNSKEVVYLSSQDAFFRSNNMMDILMKQYEEESEKYTQDQFKSRDHCKAARIDFLNLHILPKILKSEEDNFNTAKKKDEARVLELSKIKKTFTYEHCLAASRKATGLHNFKLIDNKVYRFCDLSKWLTRIKENNDWTSGSGSSVQCREGESKPPNYWNYATIGRAIYEYDTLDDFRVANNTAYLKSIKNHFIDDWSFNFYTSLKVI